MRSSYIIGEGSRLDVASGLQGANPREGDSVRFGNP